MKKDIVSKGIKKFITDTTTELKEVEGKNYTNELDKLYENKKLNKKLSVYKQALVDLEKSENVDKFILKEIEIAEDKTEKGKKSREEIRKEMNSGSSIDHEKNGEINGEIMGWSDIISLCLDMMSESAKLDYRDRNKK